MTLQINLKQLKADGASNNYVLAWSNTANSWVSADANSIVVIPTTPASNSSVSGILKVVDSTTNTSILVAASANSVTTAYNAALAAYSNAVSVASADASSKAAIAYSNAAAMATTAQNMASAAYSNAVSVAATAYTNAVTYAATVAGTAYANAVALSAANSYVNTQLGLKSNLASPTFTGTLTAADVSVTGNLTVSGTTTYINTSALNIGDNIITLNADVTVGTTPTENAGIEVNRGNSANVSLLWDETNDRWTYGNTYIVGSLTANTGLLSANTIQFNDGSRQTTFVDPIAMAIALG